MLIYIVPQGTGIHGRLILTRLLSLVSIKRMSSCRRISKKEKNSKRKPPTNLESFTYGPEILRIAQIFTMTPTENQSTHIMLLDSFGLIECIYYIRSANKSKQSTEKL